MGRTPNWRRAGSGAKRVLSLSIKWRESISRRASGAGDPRAAPPPRRRAGRAVRLGARAATPARWRVERRALSFHCLLVCLSPVARLAVGLQSFAGAARAPPSARPARRSGTFGRRPAGDGQPGAEPN